MQRNSVMRSIRQVPLRAGAFLALDENVVVEASRVRPRVLARMLLDASAEIARRMAA
jgi:hypothetical protein